MSLFSELNKISRPHRSDSEPLVLYHGKRCPDGFASALAAWLFYEGNVECVGLEHEQIISVFDLPRIDGRTVYILDFSLPAAILEEIDQRAHRLLLLDHHRSAWKALKHCNICHERGTLFFDMKHSGCCLAWQYFFPQQTCPDLFKFIEDRDIWSWKYAGSRGFLTHLDMEPFNFERWSALMNMSHDEQIRYIEKGNTLYEEYFFIAKSLCKGATPVKVDGITGLMANTPAVFHSIVGDELSKLSNTFALLWSVEDGARVNCGLRSQRNFDCTGIATAFGGGGHAQACGFRLPIEKLPALLSGKMETSARQPDTNEKATVPNPEKTALIHLAKKIEQHQARQAL